MVPPPTEIDWARLAAFIDGEGHIGITQIGARKPRRALHHALRIRIANTDPQLMSWLLSTFGGTASAQKPGERERVCYSWDIRNARAGTLLSGCLPYFVMKRRLAELGLEFNSTIVPIGGRLTPEIRAHRAQIATEMKTFTQRGRP